LGDPRHPGTHSSYGSATAYNMDGYIKVVARLLEVHLECRLYYYELILERKEEYLRA